LIELQSLGYIVVATERLDDWTSFATGLLGMEPIDRGASGMALRMDGLRQRVVLERASGERCTAFGWQVHDAAALERAGDLLDRSGVTVRRESAALADRRGVGGLLSFVDPAGNQLEIFHDPVAGDGAFVPGRPISGFRTGTLGLGHVVLTTDNLPALAKFYTEVLGFRLSDFTLRPFEAAFYHLNRRHHSLALIQTGVNGVHHIMVELNALDDVGQGYDIAQQEPERIAVTLGRHTNDLMTSFYMRTPSNFMFEYGWGGRDIDPASWEPFECDWGPSLWGHDRSWLSPGKRAEARALRLEAARRGYRAPVHVLPGNHVAMCD
jgi:2,3-dihydroxybiphenyl 1,2-dioxygenase